MTTSGLQKKLTTTTLSLTHLPASMSLNNSMYHNFLQNITPVLN